MPARSRTTTPTRLKKLIAEKRKKGGKARLEVEEEDAAPTSKGSNVVDLMASLKKSLEADAGGGSGGSAAKSSAKAGASKSSASRASNAGSSGSRSRRSESSSSSSKSASPKKSGGQRKSA